jgi:uncharacterized protein with LGFP repeats
MPDEVQVSVGAPFSGLDLSSQPSLTLGELHARLDDPGMPAFSAAELLDGGQSLIHDGPVDDAPAAFKAIAARAVLSADSVDISSLVGIAVGTDGMAAAMINAKYLATGGAAGPLGPTTTAVLPTGGGTGWYRQFQNGRIYFTFAAGAHDVRGAILGKWIALGAEAGLMGYPVSDQQPGDDPGARGLRQRFQGGEILSFPDWRVRAAVESVAATFVAARPSADFGAHTLSASAVRPRPVLAAAAPSEVTTFAAAAAVLGGAIAADASSPLVAAMRPRDALILDGAVPSATHEVHGAIRARYDALGAESSFLGYPTTDETGCPDGVGRYNHFEAGSIYWSPAIGAHEVHGLIRDLWSAQGWERGPLGYPLTDELIPDRRIGHVHPERRRKPIVDVPFDLVKLPEAAASLGFASTVVNTGPGSMAERRITAFERTQSLSSIGPAAAGLASRGPARPAPASPDVADASAASILGAHSLVSGTLAGAAAPSLELGVALGGERFGVLVRQAASTPAADRSTNRFADFENGVAFWRRGEGAASVLAPWAHAADGSPTHFTASDVVGAVLGTLSRVFGSIPDAEVRSIAFVGTTGYSFDGAGVRNRRHRVRVELASVGPSFIFGAATALFEVHVEVTFEPESRQVVAMIADWFAGPQSGSFQEDLPRAVHARLDDLLGTAAVIVTLNDTDDAAPVAVLSVKTMSNGDVSIYVEPPNPASHWAVLNEVKVSDVLRGAVITRRTP